MRDIDKDQYYTKPEIADRCFRRFNYILESGGFETKTATYVEPSAGRGDFYKLLPKSRRVGIDIDPKCDGLIKHDFLTWDYTHLDKNKTVTIGNPPFFYQLKGVVDFFNRSALFSKYVGFITPVSITKKSKKLNSELQLIDQLELPSDSFYGDNEVEIECGFYIYKVKPFEFVNMQAEAFTDHFDCWTSDGDPGTRPFDIALSQVRYWARPTWREDFKVLKLEDGSFQEHVEQYGGGYVHIKENKPGSIDRILKMDLGRIANAGQATMPHLGRRVLIDEYCRLHGSSY